MILIAYLITVRKPKTKKGLAYIPDKICFKFYDYRHKKVIMETTHSV